MQLDLCNHTADHINGAPSENPFLVGQESSSKEFQFLSKSFQYPYNETMWTHKKTNAELTAYKALYVLNIYIDSFCLYFSR